MPDKLIPGASGFKMKGSPMQRNFGIGASPVNKKDKTASELVAERTRLRKRAAKLKKRKEEGRVTFLGKRKRRKTKEKIEKVQAKINVNPQALQWKKDAETKKKMGLIKTIKEQQIYRKLGPKRAPR